MKITFILPFASLSGGVRVAAIYARKLHERGHSVTVISQPAPPVPSALRQLVRRVRGQGKTRRHAHTKMLDFLGDRHIVLDRIRSAKDADVPDADVIIATWWETAFTVSELSPSKGKKFYFVQGHEIFPHLPTHISHGSYFLPLKKITISQWLIDMMATRYGDTDVALIENSVDTAQFHAPARARQAAPTVGLLYSPVVMKGLDVSLKAIEKAREKFPDLKVVAFGENDPVSEFPLPPGSEFHRNPAQDSIRDIYASCDVWLCGSRSEGFHLPPLEAMACRCPVVATRVGGPVDCITPGVNGYLADIDDADTLGDRLIDVLGLPDADWTAMSDAALARAHAFTWDDAADAFEAELVRDPKTAPPV